MPSEEQLRSMNTPSRSHPFMKKYREKAGLPEDPQQEALVVHLLHFQQRIENTFPVSNDKVALIDKCREIHHILLHTKEYASDK